jgi:hypothetical protein
LVETTMPENQCRFWLCLNFSEEDSCVCILYLWVFRFVWFRKNGDFTCFCFIFCLFIKEILLYFYVFYFGCS